MASASIVGRYFNSDFGLDSGWTRVQTNWNTGSVFGRGLASGVSVDIYQTNVTPESSGLCLVPDNSVVGTKIGTLTGDSVGEMWLTLTNKYNFIRAIQNSAGIVQPPPAPTLTIQPGGSGSASTVSVKITLVAGVNGERETGAGAASTISVPTSNVVVVQAPALVAGAVGYNVYAGPSGSETKQNSTPLYFFNNWVQPSTGLITGAYSPSATTTTATTTVDYYLNLR